MKVYVLQHEHDLDGSDEVKFIGVYGSKAEAEAARERCRQRPGFCQYPDGFSIDGYEIGADQWTEGFVTPSFHARDPSKPAEQAA